MNLIQTDTQFRFITTLLNNNQHFLLYQYYSDIHQYQKSNLMVISYAYVLSIAKSEWVTHFVEHNF